MSSTAAQKAVRGHKKKEYGTFITAIDLYQPSISGGAPPLKSHYVKGRMGGEIGLGKKTDAGICAEN